MPDFCLAKSSMLVGGAGGTFGSSESPTTWHRVTAFGLCSVAGIHESPICVPIDDAESDAQRYRCGPIHCKRLCFSQRYVFFVAGAWRSCNDPAAIGGDAVGIEDAFLSDLPAGAPICFHAIEKARAAFYRAEDDVIVGEEERGVFDNGRRDAYGRGAAAGRSDPQVRGAALVDPGKSNLLSIAGYCVILHRVTRQYPLHFSAAQVLDPQLLTWGLAVGHQEIETAPVRRKRRRRSIAFG